MKIAVIAHEPLYSYLKQFPEIERLGAEMDFYLMETLADLTSIFGQIQNSYDAFITGGQSLNLELRKQYAEEDYIIEPILLDHLGLCKVLLRAALENGLRDFSRVFFDFVHNEDGHQMVEQLLGSSDFLHIPLQHERKNDIVIQRFSEIEPFLRKTYMPVSYTHLP